ncbi:hypothetical protein CEP54_014184 [Fusarium duplospermum]|uniref:Aldehyde dehydrogenase domain-containing protein n=1 Tax=Fusarium duplospermum TaxID=1325734 RepID=A0A428NXU8_9HYPO|nr:hypothetical protein CEP54_014184 [Fusarium duplospermum]
MPLHYIPAFRRYRVDSETAIKQLNSYISMHPRFSKLMDLKPYRKRWDLLAEAHRQRLDKIAKLAEAPSDGSSSPSTSYLCARLRRTCPKDTICNKASTPGTSMISPKLFHFSVPPYAQLEPLVENAHHAFAKWSKTKASARRDIFLAAADIFDKRREELGEYKRAFPVAVGQYITEIDVNNDDANCKVLSDTALAKFLKIREKWDPNELFPNYKAFVRAHDKINRLQNRSQL